VLNASVTAAVGPGKLSGLFAFSGQTELPSWRLAEVLRSRGWSEYEAWIRHEKALCFQMLRELLDEFPTWQNRKHFGRPAADERDILGALVLRQFLRVPFSKLPEAMEDFQEVLRFQAIHQRSTLTEKNRSRRFQQLLRRFFEFVVQKLGPRSSILITDATGFSNYMRAWRDASYEDRATNNWIKAHCIIERETGLFVRVEFTPGRVHESQVFRTLWESLPPNVRPRRSLADAAFVGNDCLEAVRDAGATPMHAIKSNARHHSVPTTDYQKLVNFATHWPNRYAQLGAPRKEIEGAFGQTKTIFGYRLTCHKQTARENEIIAKLLGHNIHAIAFARHITAL